MSLSSVFNSVGQSCLTRIDSVFINSDTVNFEQQIGKLDDSCKIGWYHFYLGKANYFLSRIPEFESNTWDLLISLSKDPLSMENNYILRSRAGFMIVLLVEEFRRTKNRKKFNFWKGIYKKLNLDQYCSTPYSYRIRLGLEFMKIRFRRSKEVELVEYYTSLCNEGYKRYCRRFFNY